LLIAALLYGTAATEHSAAPPRSADVADPGQNRPSVGGIGIGLLDPPVRADDPRARIYIVDHVHPDTRFSRRLQVSNSTNSPLRVSLYAAAARIHDSAFTFAPDRTQNELSSWISLDSASFAIPPHSRRSVSATVRVPANVSTAERYAVVWAEVRSTQAGPGGNLRLVNRVGVRVYLHVGPGAEPPSAFQIESLAPGQDSHGRPQVQAIVHNTGRRALDLTGDLTLTGPAGQHTLVRVRPGLTLAPGNTTSVVAVLDDELPNGRWTARLALETGSLADTATMTVPNNPASASAAAAADPAFPGRLVLGGGGIAVLTIMILAANRHLRRFSDRGPSTRRHVM
jgi:hypothetical protein